MMNNWTQKQQRWRQLWPTGFIALLATIQLILTFSIIGLETTSAVFDLYHSMIFAGFFCSLFFMITWISMFTVTCCNRHSLGCATHVLVENILSIIAASVLLYFDNLFLNDPYICLYASNYQCFQSYISGSFTIYDPTNYTVKIACIKAQLACAAVILVTSVIYIIIFIVVSAKTRNANNEVVVQGYGPPMPHAPAVVSQPILYGQQPPTHFGPSVPQQRIVQCPQCHTLIQIN